MSFASDRNVYHQRHVYVIFILAILTGVFSGCGHREGITDRKILHDRLINLMITENLPFGKDGTALRTEIITAGKWLKKHLVRDSSRRFRFMDDPPAIMVVKDPDVLNISNRCYQYLVRLQTFFIRNHAVPKQIFERENLERAFLSQESRSRITELVEKSMENNRSETGGVATLDESGGEVNFLPIESLNEKLMDYLESAGRDPVSAMECLEDIRPVLPVLKIRAARTLDAMISASTQKEKLMIYRGFLDLYRTYSVYSYDLDQASQYAAIAASGAPGYYLGLFHVHPQNNRPSPEDRIQSFLKPNIVIVPLNHGYEIHILDYRIHPDPEPVIFRSG